MKHTNDHTKRYGILGTLLWRPFPTFIQWLFFVLCPVASFYLMEVLTHDPVADIHLGLHMYNWILYLAFYGAGFFLLGHMRWSHLITTIAFAAIGVANMLTLEFRGAPILPWDIRSLGTAVSVLDNQSMTLTPETIHILCGFGLLIFLSLHCDRKAPALKQRLSAGLATAALLAAMSFGVQTQWLMDTIDIYEMPFTQGYTYRQNGFVVSFLMNAKYLSVDKPEDYDVEELEETIDETLEEALLEEDTAATPVTPASPNIIVIMNEAFSDLSVLGDLHTNKDYMPYFRSLTENIVRGTTYVSVLGGNTANSEFEFLTGDSMAFLPTGSIPYQQYIQSEIPTLVDVLAEQGYYSVAMHPYYASGWERDSVYDWMGFDEKHFLSDFAGAQKLRQYISDWGMYETIINNFNDQRYLMQNDQPLFYFGVTMQNHSGYSKEYDNFSNDVHVLTDNGKTYKYADTYLSLIAESDRAYQRLIEYFSIVDEPTIILMFGDHQPHSLETGFFKNLMGKHPQELDLEETVLRYQTPFVLWANYDIEEQTDVELSLNYLSTFLLKSADLELSEYQEYLWQIHEELPIITANFYIDTQGQIYSHDEEEPVARYEELLTDYSSLQYNHLFDEEHRLVDLFELPEEPAS